MAAGGGGVSAAAPSGAEAAAAAATQHPLPFRLLRTGPCSWDPGSANVTLNVRLDGCIVPSEASEQGARIAYSHAVVLDDFIEDATRQQLLQFLLTGHDGTEGETVGGASAAATAATERGEGVNVQSHRQLPPQQQGQQQQQQQRQHAEDSVLASLGVGGGDGSGVQLPAGCWERRTTDMAGAAATWGVKPHILNQLAQGCLPALQEVHARLCRLYPECDIAHLPSDAIQLQQQGQGAKGQQEGHQQQGLEEQRQQQVQQQAQQQAQQHAQERSQQADASAEPCCELPAAKRSKLESSRPAQPASTTGGSGGAAINGSSAGTGGGCDDGGSCGNEDGGGDSGQPAVDCACFVANAAVEGDSFRFHVDADPTSFPDGSPWHVAYGDYWNGEPGRPLLVSLLLYLNPEWRREWGADTLFLDGQTDTGIFVAPRPCRAVLFDQDILHRVSAPSAAAGGRPRFSLVWKLALLPHQPGQQLCIARPEWGPPTSFGSAARVDAVKRQLAAERRQQGGAR